MLGTTLAPLLVAAPASAQAAPELPERTEWSVGIYPTVNGMHLETIAPGQVVNALVTAANASTTPSTVLAGAWTTLDLVSEYWDGVNETLQRDVLWTANGTLGATGAASFWLAVPLLGPATTVYFAANVTDNATGWAIGTFYPDVAQPEFLFRPLAFSNGGLHELSDFAPGEPVVFEAVATHAGRPLMNMSASFTLSRLVGTSRSNIIENMTLTTNALGIARVNWSTPAAMDLNGTRAVYEATLNWTRGGDNASETRTIYVRPFNSIDLDVEPQRSWAWGSFLRNGTYYVNATVCLSHDFYSNCAGYGASLAARPAANVTTYFHVEYMNESIPWQRVATLGPFTTNATGDVSALFTVPAGLPVDHTSKLRVYPLIARNNYTFNGTVGLGAEGMYGEHATWAYLAFATYATVVDPATGNYRWDYYARPNSTSRIVASVWDANNTPVPNVTLEFLASLDYYSPSGAYALVNATTNATGHATVNFTVPEIPLGNYTLWTYANALFGARSSYGLLVDDRGATRYAFTAFLRGEELSPYAWYAAPGDTLTIGVSRYEAWAYHPTTHWPASPFVSEELNVTLTYPPTTNTNGTILAAANGTLALDVAESIANETGYVEVNLTIPASFDGFTIYLEVRNGSGAIVTPPAQNYTYYYGGGKPIYLTGEPGAPFFIEVTGARGDTPDERYYLEGDVMRLRAYHWNGDVYTGLTNAALAIYGQPALYGGSYASTGIPSQPELRNITFDLTTGFANVTIPSDLVWRPTENEWYADEFPWRLFADGKLVPSSSTSFGYEEIRVQRAYGSAWVDGMQPLGPPGYEGAPPLGFGPGQPVTLRWQSVSRDPLDQYGAANVSWAGANVSFFLALVDTTYDACYYCPPRADSAFTDGVLSWDGVSYAIPLGFATSNASGAAALTALMPAELPATGFDGWGADGFAYRIVAYARDATGDYDRTFTRSRLYFMPIPPAPPAIGNLTGLVRDANTSAPIAGAHVGVLMGETPVGGNVTGADGVYVVRHLPVGEFVVAAGAPGYYPASMPVNITKDGLAFANLSLVPLPPQRNLISGNVSNATAPLANVTVLLVDVETGSPVNETVTNASGEFKMNANDGSFAVIASLGEFDGYDAQIGFANVSDGSNATASFVLDAAAPAQMTLDVVFPSWSRADFHLLANLSEDAQALRWIADNMLGDRNGVVNATESAAFFASAEGEPMPPEVPLSVDGIAFGPIGTPTMLSSGLEGPVSSDAPFHVNASGSLFPAVPVPDATAHAIVLGFAPPEGGDDVSGTVRTPAGYSIASRNHTANITSTLLGPNVVRIAPLPTMAMPENVTIIASLTSMTIRVIDDTTGAPVAGALVVVSGAASANLTTGTTGLASIAEPAAGTYNISVSRAGYRSATAGATVTMGNATLVTVRLERYAALNGVALDALTGGRLSGATILLESGASSSNVTSDEFGRFAFSGLEGGAYNLSASRSGYETTVLALTLGRNESRTMHVNLTPRLPDYVVDEVVTRPAAPIAGSPVYVRANVTNAGSGDASAGSWVTLSYGGETRGWTYLPPLAAGETGTLDLGSVTPATAGNHTIRVVADHWAGVRESNESNNGRNHTFAVTPAPPAELLPGYVGAVGPFVAGEPAHFGFYVEAQNAGAGPVGPFWVNLTLPNGSVIASARSHGVSPSASTWIYLSGDLLAAALSPPSLDLTVRIDPGNLVVEENETNNNATVTAAVVEFGLEYSDWYPDMQVGSPWSPPYTDQPTFGYVYYEANGSARAWANLTTSPGISFASFTTASQTIRTSPSAWNWYSFYVKASEPGEQWVNLTIERGAERLWWNETVFFSVPLVEVKNHDARSGSAAWNDTLRYRVFDYPSFPTYNTTTNMEIVMEGGSEGRIVTGLDALLSFPYGCVEQTTSGVRASYYAQLYYFDRAALTTTLNSTLSGYVQAGIERLQTGERKPVSDQGWNQWADYDSPAETFFTLYAMGFLLDAKNTAGGWYDAYINDSVLVNGTKWIVNNQSADGGWEKKAYGYIATNVTLTAMALQDLNVANATYTDEEIARWSAGELTRDAINASADRALRYLLAARNADGGWGLAPLDNESNPYTTARVLIALLPYAYGANATLTSAVEDGAAWLAANQNLDGSWDSNPEHSHWMWGRAAVAESTGMALLALNGTQSGGIYRSNTNNATVASGFRYLLGAFEPGPGWGSNKATGTVIEALTRMDSAVLDATVELSVGSSEGDAWFGTYNLTNLEPTERLRFEHLENGTTRLIETGAYYPGLLRAENHSIRAWVNGTGIVGVKVAVGQDVPLDEAKADAQIVPYIDPLATNFTTYAQAPATIIEGQAFNLTLYFQNLNSTMLQTPMLMLNITDGFDFVNTSEGGVSGIMALGGITDRYGFTIARPGGGSLYGEHNLTEKKLYFFPDYLLANENASIDVRLVPRVNGAQTLEVTGTMMYDLTTIWPHNATFTVTGVGTINLTASGGTTYAVDGASASGAVSALEGAHWVNATAAGSLPLTMRVRVDPSVEVAPRFAAVAAADLYAPRVTGWVGASAPLASSATLTSEGVRFDVVGAGQAAVRAPLLHGHTATSVWVGGAPAAAWIASATYVDVFLDLNGTAAVEIRTASGDAAVDGRVSEYTASATTSPADETLDPSIDLRTLYAADNGTTTRFAWVVRGAANLSKTYQVEVDTNGDLAADKRLNVSLVGTGIYSGAGALLSTDVEVAVNGSVVEASVPTSALGASAAALRFLAVGSLDATPWLTPDAGAIGITWTVPSPSEGTAIPLTVTVRNFGGVATGPLVVSLLVDGVPSAAPNATLDGLDANETGTAVINWTAIQGTFNLSALVAGVSTNQSATLATITVAAVDTVAPIIGSNAPTGTTSGARPAISASWSDAATGIAIGSASIRVDGANVTSSATLSATGFTYTPPTDLAAGAHAVNVSVSDAAGNAATLGWAFTVPSAAPGGGGTTPGGTTPGGNQTTQPLTASNATLAEASSLVGVTLAQPFRASDANGDGAADTFSDPNGVLRLLQPATTLNGSAMFVIARTGSDAPAFLWLPATDALIEVLAPTASAPTVSFDPSSGKETVTVTVAKGDWVYFAVSDAHPGAPLVVRTSDGRVIASDRVWRSAGRIAVLDDPDTVYSFVYDVPDATPPAVAFAAPPAGSEQAAGFAVTVTATDDRGVLKVELFAGTVKLGEDVTVPYEFVVSAGDFPAGALVLTARATDTSANVGEATRSVTVIRPAVPDTTAPMVSVVAPSGPQRGVVRVPVDASDNFAVAKVELFVDGTKVGEDLLAPFEFDVDTSKLAAGTHTLRAVATDTAGNAAEDEATLDVAGAVQPTTPTPVPTPTPSPSADKEEEGSSTWLWIALALLGVAVVAFAVVRLRKR